MIVCDIRLTRSCFSGISWTSKLRGFSTDLPLLSTQLVLLSLFLQLQVFSSRLYCITCTSWILGRGASFGFIFIHLSTFTIWFGIKLFLGRVCLIIVRLIYVSEHLLVGIRHVVTRDVTHAVSCDYLATLLFLLVWGQNITYCCLWDLIYELFMF